MTPARIAAVTVVVLIMLAAVFMPPGFNAGAPLMERERLLMGTIVRIKAPVGRIDGGKERVGFAIGKALDEIARIEGVFSVHKPDSEISRINRLRKGEVLKISDEVFGLIEKSVEYSARTKGAFDITVKPLADLWREAGAAGRLPLEAEVDAARAKVGYRYIALDKSAGTVSFARDGMSLDMGGVGKGYASDAAAKILRENGVADAIINPGGDVYCMGRRSTKSPWNVGIKNPRDKNELFLEIALKDMAIDTAGDYEKYFLLDGKRYSHIIDPRTGYPAGDDVISASVIAPDAVTADILATALCVLGRDGLKIVRAEGLDAVIVFGEGGAFGTEMTEGFKKRYDVKAEAGI
ncbi:MAG: FAD:protein FMN transferase [Candidatus Omnitrophica bacterium]|nr:FAD:protein FMN transferase [Candidatus Omnitrophota bacterium]